MSQLPDKLWLRRGEVRTYLNLTEPAMTKLIENKVLTPLYFRGEQKAWFDRDEVLKIKPEARPDSKNGKVKK